MTKVFNTHIEAARYLLEKPTEHEVYVMYGRSKIYFSANEFGTISNGQGDSEVLEDYSPPFKAVEPEKSNEDYVEELCKLDSNFQSDRSRSIARKWLEIMDEKIKKALAR